MRLRSWLSVALLSAPVVALAVVGPTIATTASTFAVEGAPYHYADMDKAVATGGTPPYQWSAPTAPPGFFIDPSSGVITWTPADKGDQPVTLQVTDDMGMMATQMFTVHVAGAPDITSTPATSASVGRVYLYDANGALEATSVDGTPTFGIDSGPSGMVVNATTGVVTWVPEAAGTQQIVLFAQNAFGKRQQTFDVSVTVDGRQPPVLSRTWNQFAAVGQPYAFSPTRALSATGDQPITFSKISTTPDNLFVDATTGSIAWIPKEAKVETIRVRAHNFAGDDDFEFTVTVEDGVTARPTAMATATPQQGAAPLSVAFDSAGSMGGGNAPLLSTEWDFGDGSPPTQLASVSHTYRTAGSRTARLTATNGYGFSSVATLPVVATQDGLIPPTAKLVAKTPVKGKDRLEVEFDCECTDGSKPIVNILWDFGDTNRSTAKSPKHTFLPGGYRVRLTVTDDAGISAEDSIEVSVGEGTREPPSARVYADPPTPDLGQKVSFLATALDLAGQIDAVEWDFGDGTTHLADYRVDHTYMQPGVYEVSFVATADSGLKASDHVTVTVLKDGVVPAEILSLPQLVAYVGVKYRYDEDGLPQARGSRPLNWILGDPRPAGMDIQRQTGEILWTPTEDQLGDVTVSLRAANTATQAVQELRITVLPASQAPGGCAMTSVRAGLHGLNLLALCAVALLLRRRRSM